MSDLEEVGDLMAHIGDLLVTQGFDDCRLCDFRAYGTPSEILEQLGQHGDDIHEVKYQIQGSRHECN